MYCLQRFSTIALTYRENNIWVRGNTTLISSVESVSCLTREIRYFQAHIYYLFCLLYKKSMHTIITQTHKIQTTLL